MLTIAAQIVLHSVVKAMDWRNNVYVPVLKLLSILFAIAAMLERGMGQTKRIVDGRDSMGSTTIKALKIVGQVN